MLEVKPVNYTNAKQAQELVDLMCAYSIDQMGGGTELSDQVKNDLPRSLASVPNAYSFIAYVHGVAAGLINTFEGFSTFKCKPLLNIHDVVVLPEYRGQGISQAMLNAVEDFAMQRGCIKLTLEVLEGNQAAQESYLKYGFSGYELDPKMGKALFWEKLLT
jgi:ribosomal protein S18 acetylase RimI-like enzyme